MPELPEVETTRTGISPHIQHQKISVVNIYAPKLRWPIPINIPKLVKNKKINSVTRRAKYLLLNLDNGTIIMHLGMSGKIQILDENLPRLKHDHFEIVFDNGTILRLNDPRRFGAVLWSEEDPNSHKLLCNLGPEPFDKEFNYKYLLEKMGSRKTNIKTVLMDNKVVVGVGNIYANEVLFACNINPLTSSSMIIESEAKKLVKFIQKILKKAIEQGGTTLKDFLSADGNPGYFAQSLKVYGRKDQECYTCSTNIESVVIGQRNTFYCPQCQPNK